MVTCTPFVNFYLYLLAIAIPLLAPYACQLLLPAGTGGFYPHLLRVIITIASMAVFVGAGFIHSAYLIAININLSGLLSVQVTLLGPLASISKETATYWVVLSCLFIPSYTISHTILYSSLRRCYEPSDLGAFGKGTAWLIAQYTAMSKFVCWDGTTGETTVTEDHEIPEIPVVSPPSYYQIFQVIGCEKGPPPIDT